MARTPGRHEDRDHSGVADFAEWEQAEHRAWLAAKLARPVFATGAPYVGLVAPKPATSGAAVAWGVDAAASLSVADVRAQGATFVCCYLAPASQSWKVRTPAQWQAYLDAGISVVANWETDGTPGNGYSTGVDAAEQAQTLLEARGHPDAPVIFTFADSGAPNLALVLAAVQGAVSVLGWSRVGAYGGIDTIAYLADRNACGFYWQTYAWSSGRRDPRAQLYQRLNDQAMDFDVAYADDFAQIPRPITAPPTEVDMATPQDNADTLLRTLLPDPYAADHGQQHEMNVGDQLSWACAHAAYARFSAAQAVAQLAGLQAAVDKLADAVATQQGIDAEELKTAVADAIADAVTVTGELTFEPKQP